MCDDTSYALRAKSFKDEALAAKVPAITTGGIYPGVSNGTNLISRHLHVLVNNIPSDVSLIIILYLHERLT